MSYLYLVIVAVAVHAGEIVVVMNMQTCKLEACHSFCLQLLIEEGLLMGRMLDQQERYPRSAACLALTAFPLLAVAEHDAIPFLNNMFGLGLSVEDPRITTIRHMTKSLDSKNIDYGVYSEEAHAVIQALGKQFYSPKGLGSLLKPLRTNIGIAYYQQIPIYANYSTMHLLSKDNPDLMQSPGHAFEKEVGYEAGTSGAVIYAIAKEFVLDAERYCTKEFNTQANDWKYERLMLPLRDKGVEDEVVFFFFSELLMLLTSVIALREAGFLDDAVWLKYSSLTLDHAWRAISGFSAYIRGNADTSLPVLFLDEVGHLLSRDEAKFIKKSRRLRNAMMHYDFRGLVPDGVDGSSPWAVMDAATMQVCGMPVRELGDELFRVRDKLAVQITRLIGFPEYSPARKPWGW